MDEVKAAVLAEIFDRAPQLGEALDRVRGPCLKFQRKHPSGRRCNKGQKCAFLHVTRSGRFGYIRSSSVSGLVILYSFFILCLTLAKAITTSKAKPVAASSATTTFGNNNGSVNGNDMDSGSEIDNDGDDHNYHDNVDDKDVYCDNDITRIAHRFECSF